MFFSWRGCAKPDNTDVLSEKVVSKAIVQLVQQGKLPHKPSAQLESRKEQTYIPPEAKVVLTPKDPTKSLSEVVDIRVKYFGFCFKPGIQVSFPLGVGLDAKLFYYRRYGLGTTLYYLQDRREVAVGIFASRHFLSFDNIESVAGLRFNITGDQTPYVGLRLSF